jgi:hypothetical protein
MKRLGATLKRFFIPHDGNDHKPQILRLRSVVFVLMLAVVIESIFWFGTVTLAPHSELFGVIVVNALVDGTNANRLANDEVALRINPLLTAAAQAKANDMATKQYFAHTSPDGLTPWYWFGKVGYQFMAAGENLAVNFSNSADVTDAWMNSPDHRENILDARYSEIGMATARGTFNGHSAVYVVELFGSPSPFMTEPTTVATAKTVKPTNVVSVATSPAVAGAKTQIISQMDTAVVATATASAPAMATLPIAVAENNPIQNVASNPRNIVNDIYLAVILLFMVALILNIFIKIRIQHPQIIMGGMLVILIAGSFIIWNQQMFANVIIF